MTEIEEIELLRKELKEIKKDITNADEQSKEFKAKATDLRKKQNNLSRTIKRRLADKARKERTHHLIQLGGLVEKYAGIGENQRVNLVAFESYCEKYQFALSQLAKDVIEVEPVLPPEKKETEEEQKEKEQ